MGQHYFTRYRGIVHLKAAVHGFLTIHPIPEPFVILDTEYTVETHERLQVLLSNYGLDQTQVGAIRQEVAVQMFKYNFDCMVWEWGGLGAIDVLRAMRTKYNATQFSEFYQRVMSICLLPDAWTET